jgi:VCBS repeat-containing protein
MTARDRLLALRGSPWLQRRRGRLALVGISTAVIGLAVAATVQAVTIAASASVSPSFMYLGDTGAQFTATVTNTGTSSLGAVEVERPSNSWSVVACPAGPAGWSIQQDSNKCRYRSAPGTADDIAPGATSSAFRLTAATIFGNRDKTGVWMVRVSQTDSFSNPNTVVAASAVPPGLGNTAHSWQVLDAIVAAGPSTPGTPCPASNHQALTNSTQTIVICGRNRSSQAHTPSAALSTLGGTFIASPGTFSSASIPGQSATSVVLGNWTGVTVTNASGSATVVVQIRSAVDETSPLTTFSGYMAINRPPSANDDSATTNENTAATISVLANDTDPENQALSVSAVNTAGTVGSVTITAGGAAVRYDPNGKFEALGPGETATDTFGYTASDGHGGTDTATVTVTITGVNDNPDAVADGGSGFTTNEDTAFTTGSVLANDSDVEGDAVAVSGVDDSATSGTVVNNGDGTFDYDPAGAFNDLGAGETASDAFAYTISDGHGGFDTATVTITVTGVNDGPTAVGDVYSGVVGNTKAALGTTSSGPVVVLTGNVLTSNDTDPDDAATSLSASLVSATAGADVTVNSDGSFVYVPPAGIAGTIDSFTYRVTDPAGAHADATVQIAIGTDLVWYVDSAAAPSGDGRSTAPFATLAPLRGAGDADAAGAIIFVYQGSGTYAGGIPLEADQALIGQPAGLTVGANALVAAGGSSPVITNAAGDGVGLANGVSVRSINVSGASGNGISGTNATGVTVSGVGVSGSGGDGIHVAGSGSGSVGLTLTGATIADSAGTGLLVRGSGATTGEVSASDSTFDGNGVGVNVVASGSDDLTFDISGNTFTDQLGNAVQILTAAPTAGQADGEVILGQIRDNVIGGATAGSGSRDLIGIAIEINGDADAVVAVSGNTVSHTDQEGVFVQARLDNDGDASHGRLDLTLRDNTIGTPDDDSAFPFGLVHGIRIESRNTTDVCLDIAGNDSASLGGGSDFRVRQRDGSTFRLERFVGSGTSDGDVGAFVIGQNASGSTASVTHATSYTGVADGTCRAP